MRVLPLLLLLCGASVFAADKAPACRARQTPRYLLLSETTEKQTNARIAELDLMLEAAFELIEPDEKLLPPLTVLLFANDQAFEPYRAIRTKDADIYKAFFAQTPTWAIAGFSPSGQDDETMLRFRYELARWAASARRVQLPNVAVHGMATILAQSKRRTDQLEWAQFIPSYRRAFSDAAPSELERLIALREDNNPYTVLTLDRPGHAIAWTFAWRLFVDPQNRAARDVFLREWSASRPPLEALHLAFGRSAAELHAHWAREPANRPAPRVTRTPAATVAPWRAATNLEVELALARLAYATRSPEVAEELLASAHRMAPKDPRPFDLQALQHSRKANPKAPATAFEALRLGSRDAATVLQVATASFDHYRNAGKLDAANARKCADVILQAINLQPNYRDARLRFASLLPLLGELTAEDRRQVEEAIAMFPGDGDIWLGRATIALNEKNHVRACELAAEAERRPDFLSSHGRRIASHVTDYATYQKLLDDLKPRFEAREFAQARQAVQEFLSQPRELAVKSDARRLLDQLERNLAGTDDASRELAPVPQVRSPPRDSAL